MDVLSNGVDICRLAELIQQKSGQTKALKEPLQVFKVVNMLFA